MNISLNLSLFTFPLLHLQVIVLKCLVIRGRVGFICGVSILK